MKNGKGPDTLPTKPTKPGGDDRFSAYGWVRELENPFTLDNPWKILEYLVETATPLQDGAESTDIRGSAAALLGVVDRFLTADAEHRADKSEAGYRKALVAMFMLGVQSSRLEGELSFPSKQKLKALKREIGQINRFAKMMEANKDREVGRRVVQSIAMDYARIRWMEDTNQEIRIGAMTRIVWEWMAEHEQLVEHRPNTEKHLREWLKPVAADYPHAQERGRRGKR